MAALKSSELKYSNPLITKGLGDYFLTITRVEIPSGKEYIPGELELNLAKLGLPDEAPGGTTSVGREASAGEAASTTALPAAVWNSNLVNAKIDAEAAKKEVGEGYLAQVSIVGAKVILRVYSIPTAGAGEPIVETKESTKKTFTAAQALTVFCLGK